MMIVYPTTDWDTFVDVARANTIIGGYVTSAGKTAYLALATDAEKEAVLRQTAMQINLCPSITLPDTLESNLEQAQCYLVIHSMTIDTTAFNPNDRAISEEKVGSLGVKYDTNNKPVDNSEFPPMTAALLKGYGCNNSTSDFAQGAVIRA